MEFDVKKFSKLARIKLTKEEESKFGKDFSKILSHFKELQEIKTEKVPPVTGGTDLKNIFQEDVPEETKEQLESRLDKQFPEEKGGYLKVPKIFE